MLRDNGKSGQASIADILKAKGSQVALPIKTRLPASKEEAFQAFLDRNFDKAEKTGCPHTEWARVDRQAADLILNYSRGNRSESSGFIDRYNRDIATDAWKTTHQGFALSVNRVLLDGHHRLRSIPEDGSLFVAITFGLQADAVDGIDNGKGRSVGDQIAMKYGQKNTARLVAITRSYASLRNNNGIPAGTHSMLSLSEIEAAMAEIQSAWDALSPSIGREFSASFWGAVLYAFPAHPGRVAEFAMRVLRSDGHAVGDAPLTMRDWLLRTRTKGNAGGTLYGITQTHTLSAIRAYIQGRKFQKFFGESSAVKDPKTGKVVREGSTKFASLAGWFEERRVR